MVYLNSCSEYFGNWCRIDSADSSRVHVTHIHLFHVFGQGTDSRAGDSQFFFPPPTSYWSDNPIKTRGCWSLHQWNFVFLTNSRLTSEEADDRGVARVGWSLFVTTVNNKRPRRLEVVGGGCYWTRRTRKMKIFTHYVFINRTASRHETWRRKKVNRNIKYVFKLSTFLLLDYYNICIIFTTFDIHIKTTTTTKSSLSDVVIRDITLSSITLTSCLWAFRGGAGRLTGPLREILLRWCKTTLGPPTIFCPVPIQFWGPSLIRNPEPLQVLRLCSSLWTRLQITRSLVRFLTRAQFLMDLTSQRSTQPLKNGYLGLA